jgi:MATE family multidrug resistance protein
MAMSLPIIFSILSGTLMYMVDRVMLAHYSFNAMNGAAFAHQAIEIFMLPLLSFATISEVFVGQLNGSNQFKKSSDPIIQIAVFLILIWCLIYPIAMHCRHFFLPESIWKDGNPYFRVGMVIIPFQIIFSSIAAFFVGTRRPKMILYSVLVSNVVNVLLDIVLVFGIGPIPAMGAQGAALASVIAIIIASGILGLCFVSTYNAENYDTRHLNVDFGILKKNITIGAPYALSEFIEMSICVTVLIFLEKISMDAVSIQNVGVTIWIFFTFMSEGFQKGVIALASNCIGAGKNFLIKRLIRSMLIVTCFFGVCSFIPLVLLSEPLLYYAFKISEPLLLPDFKLMLLLLWITYLILLPAQSCLGGILSSGGDTKFVTGVKISSTILCFAAPLCWCYFHSQLTALTSWWLGIFQQIFNGTFFYCRYRKGQWTHNLMNLQR